MQTKVIKKIWGKELKTQQYSSPKGTGCYLQQYELPNPSAYQIKIQAARPRMTVLPG